MTVKTALKAAAAAAVLAAVLLLALLPGCGRKAPALFKDTLPDIDPDPNTHVSVSAASEPVTIYKPPVDGSGYRYGPSIMYYADGSCDAWFSTPGWNGEWDWITYKHSDDGINFTGEKVVLMPTPDSMDKYSCCDPGVIYFGGYYYLGYTSTIVEGGVNNNVFVARSKNPDGPYEKWNGSGWGGDPAPIVYYDEEASVYGAGEPSMVIHDGVLYMFYSWACPTGDHIRVATSDTEEDWPARLTYRGEAYEKINSRHSADIAYLEDAGKFVAFTTQYGHDEKSGLFTLESDDGITFVESQYVCEGMYKHLHSLGVSRRPDGHIQLKDELFVGYAFSDGGSGNWGKWATAFQAIKLELYQGDTHPEGNGVLGVQCGEWLTERPEDPPMIGIGAYAHVVEMYPDDKNVAVYFVWLDPMLSAYPLEDTGKLKFSGYDSSLIDIKNFRISAKGKTGETTVKVKYKQFEAEFKVYVRDSYSQFQGNSGRTVTDFTPVIDRYELKVGEVHLPQIRGLVQFSDNTWAEAYNSGKMSVSVKRFPVTYEVSDPAVISVSDQGIITPLAPGNAEVKVTIAGEKSFIVKVTVI